MSKNDDEVLVRVEGVSKKFCRSLKKSLWYGVCDIASELNPFGRIAAFANPHKNLTTEDTESTDENTGVNQRPDSAEFLEGHSQAGLQMDSEKLASIRSANDSRASGEQTGSDSESVKFDSLDPSRLAPAGLPSAVSRAAAQPPGCGKKSSSALDSTHGLRAGEFFAVKDVSFELRRGECLGLIRHNGSGTQAAWQPLGRLPQVAHRVRRRGKARINTTLLKMLNGLIKPDAGAITMRGRVGALIALGAGFNPILTGREPKGWEACRKSNCRLARRVQRRKEGANQNIYINGSVLGLTKKEIDAKIDEIIDFAEIREFIDMPVQSYSSGMQVRLGFAVATALDPDVLIVDEVLAVGGAEF
jgi:ABC-type polysaccharide/polyol phosphate transport system ATPase subunit